MLEFIFGLFKCIKSFLKNMLRDKPILAFVLLCGAIILTFLFIIQVLVYATMHGFFVYAWIGLSTIMLIVTALIIAYRTRLKEPVAPIQEDEIKK